MMPSPRKNILCVDDQEDFQELLAVALARYSITTANSFADGLNLTTSQAFDLYLLDNWLPDGSGIDLCRSIRAFDHSTPIIFVSAAAYSKDHTQAIEAGATAYLNKPVELINLETMIDSLLRVSEARALEARIAELEALQEAIDEYSADLVLPWEGGTRDCFASQKYREIGYSAFTRSGGSRADFERMWPWILDEVSE